MLEMNEFEKIAQEIVGKKEKEAEKYGKKVVKELFQRRNDIAHQNDRSHASATQKDIDREYVEGYIAKIELIVNAIYDIAEEKVKT